MIEQVKNYLDITWQMTDEEEAKLEGMIARGKHALEKRIGKCDFDGDTEEKTLLFVYVMYERSGALDDFWKNYASEITTLQMDRWVDDHAYQEQEV